jgi:hypothetical protein
VRVVWKVAAGVGAALAAGLVAGAAARLMMALATLAAGHESQFSIGGTAGIVVAFVLFTVPGAVLAALMRRRGRSLLLVIGALALCFVAAGIATSDLGSLGVLSTTQWVGAGAATAGVFLSILALPVLVIRILALVGIKGSGRPLRLRRRRMPQATATTGTTA